ncbi:hypothetical protein D3C85_677440 [compost metagenome]
MPRQPVQGKLRHKPGVSTKGGAVHFAQELDITQRPTTLAIRQVKVVYPQGFLVNGIVSTKWIDGQQRCTVMVHEVTANLI